LADYLPPVVTKLTGDIDGLVEKLTEAKALMQAFADEVGAIPVRFDIDEASVARVEAMAHALGDTLRPEINVMADVDIGTLNMVEQSTRKLASAESEAAKNAYLLAMAQRMEQNALNGTNDATNRAGIRIGWFGGLTANAIHWIIAGSMEFLAVAVPAIVAGAAAATVALQGVAETSTRMQAVYTTTEALGGAFQTTAGQALGLSNNLQTAQNAADPKIWELLGAGINGVKSASGGFITMGSQVINVLDQFAAKIDIEMAAALGPNGQLTHLLANGVNDLTQFGQVLGNLGHFVLNFASDMPGLAEVLLRFLDNITHILVVLTNPAWYNLGGHLITMAMAFEEAGRWGGLLLRMVGPLVSGLGGLVKIAGFDAIGNGFKGIAASMTESGKMASTLKGAFTMLATTPWGWALAAAAVVVVLGLSMAKTGDQAQQMADQMESAIGKMNVTQGMFQILQNMPKLEAATAGAAKQQTNLSNSVKSADQALHNAGSSANALNEAENKAANAGFAFKYSQNALADQTQVLTSEQQKQIGEFYNAAQAAQWVSKQYGVTLPQAYSMLNNAGLNLNTMFNKQGQLTAVAQQQIANLALGYKDMVGSGGGLGNTIDAVNVQLGLQNTKLSQVNSAWDQFLSNATGGTEAFATLESDLTTIGNVTTNATSKIQAYSQGNQGLSLSTSQVAQALTSFSGTSAQVWQNYNSSLKQAGTVTDWWRTAAASGALTGTQLNQAIATTAAQLLPYAANSKAATAELGVLVQEAGGPAISNYQQLKSWIDQNSISQGKYNNLLSNTTTQMSNVSQAAQQFSQTLQSDVIQAVANGSVNLNTITTDTSKFTQTLQNNLPTSAAVKTAMSNLATEFYHSGLNAQTAGALVYQMGINQHLTAGQAYQLEQQMIGLINTLNKTPSSEKTNITMTGAGTWTINTGASAGNVAGGGGHTGVGMAAGGRVPGWGGGDSVAALLEPGEAIVPKHLVGAVAPFLAANKVPGFAAGGVAPYSGNVPGLSPWYTNAFHTTISDMDTAMEQAIKQGMQNLTNSVTAAGAPANVSGAVALGKQMAAAYGWGAGAQWNALYALWMKESGWSANALNPASGAAGIAQSLGHGPVPMGNAPAQIAWGLQYILSQYGSPAAAWAHEVALNWYDQGGMLPPGLTLAMNGTGRPEPVGAHDGVVEVNVYLDGKQIYQSTQKQTYRANRRNGTMVTGKMSPR
jgi:hypothetical protein